MQQRQHIKLKIAVAQAAVTYLAETLAQQQRRADELIIGIGSGSTVAQFIALLPKQMAGIQYVASSVHTAQLLLARQLSVVELNHVAGIDVYFDGADAINADGIALKGGGAALTREKILASAASQFVCMIDESKLGSIVKSVAPVYVEVIQMARSHVARQLAKLGAQVIYQQSVITDNGHELLAVHQLTLTDPAAVEAYINNIAGVVANGIFAMRRANLTLIAYSNGTIAANKHC